MSSSEIVIQNKFGANIEPQIIRHSRVIPSDEGAYALQLIQHFGIVSCRVAGEDSSGRSYFTLLEPQQVVDRAFEIARLAYERIGSGEGLGHAVPAWGELQDSLRTDLDRQDAERAARKAARGT